jgi:hypothetical protein
MPYPNVNIPVQPQQRLEPEEQKDVPQPDLSGAQVMPRVTPQAQLSVMPTPQESAQPFQTRSVGYMQRANALEAQAKPPAPPQGFGQRMLLGLSEGLQGAGTPGGFQAFKQQQLVNERARQDRLLALAKEYRGESQREEQLGQTEEARQEQMRRDDLKAKQDSDRLDIERGNLGVAQGKLKLEQDDALAPKIVNTPPGAKTGIFSPKGTGSYTPLPEAEAPAKEPNREYGATEYSNDTNLYKKEQAKALLNKQPLSPEGAAAKARLDNFQSFTNMTKTQPGVVIADERGDQARKAAEQKEVTDKYNDYQNYDLNYKTMKDAFDRVTSGKSANPGTDDMTLLFRHIGMTVGAVKGGRVNQAIVLGHLNALPATDRLKVMYNKLVNGGQLSQAQRVEMLNLGETTRDFHKSQYEQTSKDYQWTPPGAKKGDDTPARSSNDPLGIR